MKTILANLTALIFLTGVTSGQMQHDLKGPQRKNAPVGKAAVFNKMVADSSVKKIEWKKGPDRKNSQAMSENRPVSKVIYGAVNHKIKGPRRKNLKKQ